MVMKMWSAFCLIARRARNTRHQGSKESLVVNYYRNGGGSVGGWTWSDILSLMLFPVALHISKEKRSEGMRDERHGRENNEIHSVTWPEYPYS